MTDLLKIKKEFLDKRTGLFNNEKLVADAFKFCISYSLLVEEFIHHVVGNPNLGFALASAGSFSRRELSPYSDIDVMFVVDKTQKHENEIKKIVTDLWDCGIEVSHTVREYDDLSTLFNEDLHSATAFFEIRYMLGSMEIYNEWNRKLDSIIKKNRQREILLDAIEDIESRHQKYGDSPKVLEPNVKFTAGGLRDLHGVEWMYSIKNNTFIYEQNEITTTQSFLQLLRDQKVINSKACKQLINAYKFILDVRNRLHLLDNRKNDRLEFSKQERIGKLMFYPGDSWHSFMFDYFNNANIIFRFMKTSLKGFKSFVSAPVSDYFSITLDDDFVLKENVIHRTSEIELTISDILRVFYYRGLHDARFDENLRTTIIEAVNETEEEFSYERYPSVFFREILKLQRNVGKTLSAMNEFGVIGAYLPEFRELVGFFQPGVYHCYTADEHTIVAVKNLEKLEKDETALGKIYRSLKEKDIIFIAVLLHDIAKPVDISGHEIIGAEIAGSIMPTLGYTQDDVEMVQFLVRNHLVMEQIAFRRDLNDPTTLNNFASLFPSQKALDLLYLLTYSDLSAVNPTVWTHWKSELLFELYRKAVAMIEENISGKELLNQATQEIFTDQDFEGISGVKEHLEAIEDPAYLNHFSQEEIAAHAEELEGNSTNPIFIKTGESFTNITIISKDCESLLSRLCGALTINDLNIHDAKIFTRSDGMVIDTFNITDFRTHKTVNEEKFDKIRTDILDSIENNLPLTREINKTRKKWWRIENKLFKKQNKVKISFENHEKYTIIDVYAPDKLGLLYSITRKMFDLELSIFLAKIATRADDIVDSFYVLDRNNQKVSQDEYELIRTELSNAIFELL